MHRQPRFIIENVENIYKPGQSKIECLCPKAPSNLEETKKLSQCYRCLQEFHSDCYWTPEKGEEFECPFCYIRYCLPQKSVKNILFMGYLPIPKKEKNEYRVNFTLDPKIKADKSIHVEARCLKFNQKNRYEISWPDHSSFTIGKFKSNEFRPLQNNSPLKRRADEPIKIEKTRLQIDNEIIIEEKLVTETGYKANKKCYHLVAIMLVEELSGESVVANFQNIFIPVNESKEALKESMNSSGDILIEKISVSLKCQYFGSRMKLPAKSRLCQTKHMQPFDLTNFIVSSINAKTSTRRWKCPICDRRAYDLVIDKYILDLINLNNDTNEIRFKVNGEPEMIEGKEDFESEDSNEVFKYEKNEKQESVIDLDYQDVEPVPIIEPGPIISKQILSNIEPVCLSDDDECEPEQANEEKLIPARSEIAPVKFPEEDLLTKKRKINDGATRIVCVPVPRFNTTIEISDSEDSEPYHKTDSRVPKNKIEFSGENLRKNEQLFDPKMDRIEKNFMKRPVVEVPKINPIINVNIQSFNKNILNAEAKRDNLKAFFQKSVISVDSDHEESTEEEVVKTLKEKLYKHKRSIEDEGKVEINEEDEEIFKGIFEKMLSNYV